MEEIRMRKEDDYWVEREGFLNYGVYTWLPFDDHILVYASYTGFAASREAKKRREYYRRNRNNE
jgi:hypothetical protein